MGDKVLFIAEKPSVAQEFAKALKYDMKKFNGYLECEQAVVTWCVGHLVTMSYPESYDAKLKRWSICYAIPTAQADKISALIVYYTQ